MRTNKPRAARRVVRSGVVIAALRAGRGNAVPVRLKVVNLNDAAGLNTKMLIGVKPWILTSRVKGARRYIWGASRTPPTPVYTSPSIRCLQQSANH